MSNLALLPAPGGSKQGDIFAPVRMFMFFRLAVSSSSKRARGASNFNSAILPAMSLIIEREGVSAGATQKFDVVAERVSRFLRPRKKNRLLVAVYPTRSRESRSRRRRRRDRTCRRCDDARAYTRTHQHAHPRGGHAHANARNVRVITPVDTNEPTASD